MSPSILVYEDTPRILVNEDRLGCGGWGMGFGTFVSLNSRLESNKEEKEEFGGSGGCDLRSIIRL